MAMSYIWTGMVAAALLFAAWTGQGAAVGAAALDGAGQAVELALRLLGPMLLWSGVMEVMSRAGLTEKLAALLRRPLRLLFPSARRDRALREALCCNVSANLLGLGNAATPSGVRAAMRLQALRGGSEASDEQCRLVVLNTASIQLFPTTVAALRAAAGAQAPFDILPAVWISSLLSATAGLLAARLMERRR